MPSGACWLTFTNMTGWLSGRSRVVGRCRRRGWSRSCARVCAAPSNARGPTGDRPGAGARGSGQRESDTGARSGFPDSAVPAHGVAATTGDMSLRADLQSIRRGRPHRARVDSRELVVGGQAGQVRTVASGRMGPDTGTRLSTRRLPDGLCRHHRRRGRPGAARGE